MTPDVDVRGALAAARRVLVIDIGCLGDHIHSLPALWLIRRNAPAAELCVVGNSGLYGPLTPWIERPIVYAKAGFRADVAFLLQLRRLAADVAIVITGSRHAVAFGGLSGAPLRIARKADRNKRWYWQPWLLEAVVDHPFHEIPMYRQRWNALKSLGLDGERPEFHASIDAGLRRAAGLDASLDGRYLHFSASATDDLRDLPPAQMVALWNRLRARFPERPVVVSGHHTARGRAKLAAILAGIGFRPDHVFDGSLDVPGFVSVVQGAALHVGPDSGGLHVARLADTPSVSWFRPNHHLKNWLPDDPDRHRAFVAPESRADGLHGLDLQDLIDAAAALLDPPGSSAG